MEYHLWRISFYFERPFYQVEVVKTYFDKHISPKVLPCYKAFINQNGRASPDLSLQGYSPDNQGRFDVHPITPSGGTRGDSAWAALVGLLNDARFRAGMSSMGFLNPWPYKYGVKGLIDITQGASLGCLGRNIQRHRVIPGARIIPWVSWNATEGCDPATGLGFPDFQRLLALVLNVPGRKQAEKCPYQWV